MLLNSGTAGGERSSLRPLNDENAGTENRSKGQHPYTKKAKNVRLAPAPKPGNVAKGTKTPAQSQRMRRALGDISNRKPNKSQGGGGAKAIGGGASNKAKNVSFQTTSTPCRSARTGRDPGSTQYTPFAGKVGVTTKGSGRKTTGRPVLTPHHGIATSGRDDCFALPQSSVSFGAGLKPDAAAVVQKSRSACDTPKVVMTTADHVEDVELPAGRLWDEENNDFFDDDELHGSFEDLRGAQDDVDVILHNQRKAHQRAIEKYLADADSALAEKMEKIALEDYEDVMGGMDKFLDGIEESYSDDPLLHQSFDRDIHRQPIDDDFPL